VGWAIHQLRPPVYEAVGQFSASIDFVGTGPLTQYEEDVALNAIGSLIGSRLVVDRVVEQAKNMGIKTDATELVRMAAVERKFTTWELRIRSTDPQRTAQIANLWVEQAQALLLESYQHALLAEQISRYSNSLESCLEQSAVSEPSSALCSRSRFVEIQFDLQQAGEALYRERTASRGLFAGLTIGPANPAVIPEKPVIFGRNQLVLAGSMIGLLGGIALFSLGAPVRWMKRS
jgi:hypothetical protein